METSHDNHETSSLRLLTLKHCPPLRQLHSPNYNRYYNSHSYCYLLQSPAHLLPTKHPLETVHQQQQHEGDKSRRRAGALQRRADGRFHRWLSRSRNRLCCRRRRRSAIPCRALADAALPRLPRLLRRYLRRHRQRRALLQQLPPRQQPHELLQGPGLARRRHPARPGDLLEALPGVGRAEPLQHRLHLLARLHGCRPRHGQPQPVPHGFAEARACAYVCARPHARCAGRLRHLRDRRCPPG